MTLRDRSGGTGMMSEPVYLVRARSAAKIVAAVERAGGDVTPLLQSVGFDPVWLDDPDQWIPNSQLVALFERAARATGDDCFGLHLAERTDLRAFDVFGYTILNAGTLGKAFDLVMRYYRLWTDGGAFEVRREGNRVKVTYSLFVLDTEAGRQECEFTLTATLQFVRLALGRAVTPREVTFRHAKPSNIGEHARIFGLTPRFGRARNMVVLDRELMDARLATADPGLSSVLCRAAEEMLAKCPELARLSDRVAHLLGENLRGGGPGLEATARKLGMSGRTLQRRLEVEGTSHRELLDDVRRKLALQYLAGPETSVGEIADRLGFTDAATFHRAFRRWTGRTPGEHRRQSR